MLLMATPALAAGGRPATQAATTTSSASHDSRLQVFAHARAPALQNAPEATKPKRISLRLGTRTINVELADTPEVLYRGLMHRNHLEPDDGMLFMLDSNYIQCFWMKNTLINLSIAFMDSNGRIVSIQDMQAHSRDSHCPDVPAAMALEMNQGWFARARVQVGDRVQILP